MDTIDTWQEGAVWYAAYPFSAPEVPVGEGETEEDALFDLRKKIEDYQEEARLRWEMRNDED